MPWLGCTSDLHLQHLHLDCRATWGSLDFPPFDLVFSLEASSLAGFQTSWVVWSALQCPASSWSSTRPSTDSPTLPFSTSSRLQEALPATWSALSCSLNWAAPKYRMKASVFAQVPFAISFLYLVFLSLCRQLSSPSFLHLPPNPSWEPRWLVSKLGRACKGCGSAALASIAKSNNLPAPGGNGVLNDVVEGEQQGICSLVLPLHHVLSLNLIVITLCYYRLNINSGNQDLFMGLGSMAAWNWWPSSAPCSWWTPAAPSRSSPSARWSVASPLSVPTPRLFLTSGFAFGYQYFLDLWA